VKCIVVWSDNTWEFFRCCRCGQLLNDAASRKRGARPGVQRTSPGGRGAGHHGRGTQEDACVAPVEPNVLRPFLADSPPDPAQIRDGLRSGQRNGARAASYRIESVDINRSACNHRTIVVRRSPTGSKGREVSMGFNKSISIYVRWPLPTA
jgi:hypothetical protein